MRPLPNIPLICAYSTVPYIGQGAGFHSQEMELECHVVDLTDALDATTFKSHIRRGGMSAFVAQLIPVEGSDIIRTNCTNLTSSSHPDALTCRACSAHLWHFGNPPASHPG